MSWTELAKIIAEQMHRFADDCRMEECEKCEDLEALKTKNAAQEQAIEAAAKLLELRTRERDAVIEDMKHAASPTGSFCEVCKHYGDKPCRARSWRFDCFEWRGVQR